MNLLLIKKVQLIKLKERVSVNRNCLPKHTTLIYQSSTKQVTNFPNQLTTIQNQHKHKHKHKQTQSNNISKPTHTKVDN